MSRRSRGAGFAAVLVSLLVVGFVRSAIPPYLPGNAHVAPDERNVVALEVADIEMLSSGAATRLRSGGAYPEDLDTDAVFVVARMRITAHGETLRVLSDLQSADGRTYRALDVANFPSPGVVHVGQRVTQTHIFEVPANRLAGAHLMIRGSGDDGVQGITPVAWFGVDADVVTGVLEIDDTIVEPAR